MKALFLAGGMGTRLKPLTDDLPKPMVPIMNKPLLERSMENLKKHGIRDIVISTGYKSQYIQDYFGNGNKFGLDIEYMHRICRRKALDAVANAKATIKEKADTMNKAADKAAKSAGKVINEISKKTDDLHEDLNDGYHAVKNDIANAAENISHDLKKDEK